VNRESPGTQVIIPGWSLLPSYIARQWPEHNLYILNPFTTPKAPHPGECVTQSLTDTYALANQGVIMISMGLQWGLVHGMPPNQTNLTLVSPAITYDAEAINHLIQNLNRSKRAALRAFYRQCLPHPDDWRAWQAMDMTDHITYTDLPILIQWLQMYGRVQAVIPPRPNVTVWMDPNDPIGTKPPLHHTTVTLRTHKRGHLGALPVC
jgi:hypothetical protein